jgi:hypothetical protein
MANLSLAKKLAAAFNPEWPTPVKYLGGGVNGRVYETNDGRLMKFIADFAAHEFMALQKLQGTYVVPRFQKGNGLVKKLTPNTSKKVGKIMFPKKTDTDLMTVFVMGRAGNSHSMTLYKYLQTHPNYNKSNVQRRVEYLIEQMALRGVSHGDLHANNIIVTVSPTGRISGMWAIDFGRAHGLKVGKTERQTSRNRELNSKFSTSSMFPPHVPRNVSVREGSRDNVNMMEAMYGKRLSPSWERRIANIRKQVVEEMKQYKSPAKGRLKTRSLRLKRRSVSASPRRGRSAPRTMP